MKRFLFASSLLVTSLLSQTTYQKPPQAVLDVLHAPLPPQALVSPDRSHMLLVRRETYPPIADLARPMLRLAGLRIDPKANGVRNLRYIREVRLARVSDGNDVAVNLPADPRIHDVAWSPNSHAFAFLNTGANGTELWVGDTTTGKVKKADGVSISAVTGEPVQWLPDSRTLLIQLVPANRGPVPAEPSVPAGPIAQETQGRQAPVRTFEDLLQNAHDEALFDYYATAQLATYDTTNGKLTMLGNPGVFEEEHPSPDGQYLLITRVHKPYSYLHPYYYFPRQIEIWDRSAKLVRQIADQPLAEIPIEGVRTGAREMHWHPKQSSSLLWVEALDGGNPKETVPFRDRVVILKPPFQGEPSEMLKTEHRYGSVEWTEDGLMLVTDVDRKKRALRTVVVSDGQASDPKVLVARDIRDRYHDVGRPVTKWLPTGQNVVLQDGSFIYLAGAGASPKGDYPFLDRLDLTTMKKERLFQSAEDQFEQVLTVLDAKAGRILTVRENKTEPPNLYIRNLQDGSVKALTHNVDPAPQFRDVHRELVTYERPDGVKLSFTLYLPPGYQKGEKLPTVFWAYPLEYSDASTAGQITGSTQQFTRPVSFSQLFFLLKGYAVLDNVAMPVVGDPETVNNTYVDQITADAKAAIDKAVEMGVTDRDRVGVGGHSYGAFMTANLLAHSNLFRAGIARSGAYNRTLTPFGFQSERRTLWEAQDVYLRMSPFLLADKIKTPILFIHGEADDNQGTFPIQSERMYQAVRGNGGTARLVMLPYEAHGYVARESVEHTLWEMFNWFDKYVKNAQPTVIPSGQ